MSKIINIESHEEITSVVNRLVNSDEVDIVLAAPVGARIFGDLINMKLLKRESDALGKRLNILTADEAGRKYARKVGFELYDESKIPALENFPEEESAGAMDDRKFFKELKETRQLGEYEARKAMLEARGGGKKSAGDDEFEKFFAFEDSSANAAAEKMINEMVPGEHRMADIVLAAPKKAAAEAPRPAAPLKPAAALKPPAEKAPRSRLEPPKLHYGAAVEKEAFAGPSKFHFVLKLLASRIFTVIAAAAFLAGFLTLYLILPRAEISVILKKESKSFSVPFSVNQAVSSVDPQKNSVPGQLIQIEKSSTREFVSTGRQQISEKAKGIIAIYNGYSSSPQTLVATTRFESSAGKIYRVQKSVVVPGAKIEDGKIVPASIDVEVAADAAGEEYNLQSGDFTIPGFKGSPKYTAFYAKSKTEISGGYEGEARIITANDAENARKAMIDEISDAVGEELRVKAPAELKLAAEAMKIQIIEAVSEPAAGSRAEKFNFKIRAKGTALLFSESDLNKLIDAKISEKLEAGKEQMAETRKTEFKDAKFFAEKGLLEITAAVDEDVVFSADEKELAENLLGKNEAQIREYLSSQIAVESAKVSFWPFWVKSVPKNIEKLKLTVQ